MKLRESDGMSLLSILDMLVASCTVADTESKSEDSRDKAEEVGVAFANMAVASQDKEDTFLSASLSHVYGGVLQAIPLHLLRKSFILPKKFPPLTLIPLPNMTMTLFPNLIPFLFQYLGLLDSSLPEACF